MGTLTLLWAMRAIAPAAEREDDESKSLAAAAVVILDDSVAQERREEVIGRHKKDSAQLLRHLTKDLVPGTPEEIRRIPWIWRVAVAAGRRNDVDELARVLEASLPGSDESLLEWQAVAIGGGIVNGIGLAGAWPAERIEAVLKEHPALRDRWQVCLDGAVGMADDEKVIPGTRYDALRIIALRNWDDAKPILERYLDDENGELQQGAVSGLSDARNEESPRLLLVSLENLTESNRELALDALVRETDRMTLLLDAIEHGALTSERLGKERLKKLREAEDPVVRDRAAELP